MGNCRIFQIQILTQVMCCVLCTNGGIRYRTNADEVHVTINCLFFADAPYLYPASGKSKHHQKQIVV